MNDDLWWLAYITCTFFGLPLLERISICISKKRDVAELKQLVEGKR